MPFNLQELVLSNQPTNNKYMGFDFNRFSDFRFKISRHFLTTSLHFLWLVLGRNVRKLTGYSVRELKKEGFFLQGHIQGIAFEGNALIKIEKKTYILKYLASITEKSPSKYWVTILPIRQLEILPF